jgi:hypothetical protein
MRLYAH